MRYGLNYGSQQPFQQLNSSFRHDSPFSDKNVYNTEINQNNRYGNHNYETNNQQLNQHTYNDRYGNNYNNQQRDHQFNNNLNNNLNDGTPQPPANGYNNPSTPSYNNNNNNNPSQPPFNANDRDPYSRDRNRFENPFDPNQDRFNLNQRFYDRQRYQQDRRYQVELEKLRNLLVETDQKGSQECTANVAAQWNFETNVNDFTQSEAVSNRETQTENEIN